MENYISRLNILGLSNPEWKGKDSTSGDIVRYIITPEILNKFIYAMAVETQRLHKESDTQIPVNPWPIEVI